MKKTLLLLLAMYSMYYANAQCNAVVFDAPNQNFSTKHCIGTPLILYAYATGGTNITYTWYKNGGAITTPVANNTYNVTALQPSDAGIYTVQVATSECPSGVTAAFTYSVQVDTAGPPAAGTQSSSTLTPCVGSTNTYGVGISNPELYDWTWSVPNGWTGSSTSSGIMLTVGDTSRSVVATATNGCGTRDFGFQFVTPVDGDPVQPDTINLHFGQLCAGNQVYLSVNAVAGNSYSWSFPSDWVQTPYVVEGIVIVTVPTSGTVTVKASNTCSTDTATYSQFITVNPQLETPIVTQVGNTLQTTAVAALYGWYDYNEIYYEYDTTITGPTGNTFTPQGNSTYALYIVDENGCYAESDTILFSGFVGIGEAENAVYAIYPNPATDVINIKAESAIDVTISDLQGRAIYTAQNITGLHPVATNNMSNGVYLVHTGSGKQKHTTKLLIAK